MLIAIILAVFVLLVMGVFIFFAVEDLRYNRKSKDPNQKNSKKS